MYSVHDMYMQNGSMSGLHVLRFDGPRSGTFEPEARSHYILFSFTDTYSPDVHMSHTHRSSREKVRYREQRERMHHGSTASAPTTTDLCVGESYLNLMMLSFSMPDTAADRGRAASLCHPPEPTQNQGLHPILACHVLHHQPGRIPDPNV